MTQTRRTPAVLAVLLVLLLACSGTAYAAGKSRGDAIITTSSLSGNRLKNDTVTGRQVRESTLAKVRRSTRADTAGRADTAATAESATSADSALVAASAESLPEPIAEDIGIDPSWTVATGYDTAVPSASRDLEGYVHLAGAVYRHGSGNLIGNVPYRFRPAARVYLPVYTTAGTPGTVYVNLVGEIWRITGDTGFVSLEGIVYRGAPLA
jgi:hypothetical protein